MAQTDIALHILAIPVPATGHTSALMHLCRSLVSPFIGFKVTFICTDECYEAAKRARNDQQEISILKVGEIPDSGSGELMIKMKIFPTWMNPILENLLMKLIAEGNGVNCILSDSFIGCVQDVANKFGIPKAVFRTSSAINDVIQIYLPQLIAKGYVPTPSCKLETPIDFIPGIPPMSVSDLPTFFNGKRPVLDVIIDGMNRYHEAQFSLCNTFEELESEIVSTIRREVKTNYYCVGPCVPRDFLLDKSALEKKRSNLTETDLIPLKWLDKQAESSVIYISFGGIITFSMEQVKEVTKGLEHAGCPFLLVIRKGLVSSSDLSTSIDDFVERNKNLGLVVPWTPQMYVLQHPAVGGFLTHCGWSSTLESICGGVPMLAWPQLGEQNVNCREIVGRLKIGIEVKEDNNDDIVSGETLGKLVKRIMGDEGKEMRNKARLLREKARNAVSSAGSSHENLKTFAQALRKHVSNNHRI